MAKLVLYQTKSPYPGDITKNCEMTGKEIDSNFLNLKGDDIKTIVLDEETNILTIFRNKDGYKDCTGEKIIAHYDIDLNKLGFVNDIKFDGKNLIGITSDGKQIIVPLSDVKPEFYAMSDGTIVGDGSKCDPLGISPVSKTGQYAPCKDVINKVDGETFPENPKYGERFVTREKVGKSGKLYPYDAVWKIAKELKNTNSPWRIPTKEDWDATLMLLEGCKELPEGYKSHYAKETGNLGRYAGRVAKTVETWQEPELNQFNGYALDIEACGFKDAAGNYVTPYDRHGVGEAAAFWSSTYRDFDPMDEDGYKVYTKRFDAYLNKSGEKVAADTVRQDVTPQIAKLSIRLVRDCDGKNYSANENILGSYYPCSIVAARTSDPELNKELNDFFHPRVWTLANLAYTSTLIENEIEDSPMDDAKIKFFVNEWNGTSWLRQEMILGDCVVLTERNRDEEGNFVVHEYRVQQTENGEQYLFDLDKRAEDSEKEIEELKTLTENIILSTGLENDGTLAPFEQEIIEGAETIKDAVEILAENATEHNIEIDNIEESVGLGENGEYIPTSGLTSEADSVMDAIQILDDATNANIDDIQTLNEEVQELEEEVAALDLSSEDQSIIVDKQTGGTDISVNTDNTTIVKNPDGSLASGLAIKKYTNDIEPNLLASYSLVDSEGNKIEGSNDIEIPKDNSLVDAKLGTEDITVDPETGEISDPGIDAGKKIDVLFLVYRNETGRYIGVQIPLGSFIQESEFKDGLKVNANGEVSVWLDDTPKSDSEKFLFFTTPTRFPSKALGLHGISDAIADAEDRAIAREDVIKENVGLNADGTHKPTEGHYTADARTIAEETAALDDVMFSHEEQIHKLNDAVDELQAEITANEVHGEDAIVVSKEETGTTVALNVPESNVLTNDANGLKASLDLIKVPGNELEDNVKEAYKLIGVNGVQIGENINIYKDSNIYSIALGYMEDYFNQPYEGDNHKTLYPTSLISNPSDKEALRIIYCGADGIYEMVLIDLEEIIIENEFGDGLMVNDHIVSVKKDSASEEYLSVSPNGVKVSGINNAIASGVAESKAYADDAVASGVAESKTYTDNAVASGVAEGKAYTDNAVASGVAEGKTYTDNAVASGVAESKTYTDNVVASGVAESKAYADDVVASGVAESKAYADDAVASGVAESKAYADNAVASGVAESKAYTDNAINNVSSQVSNLEDRVAANEDNIANLSRQTTTNTNDIATLNDSVANLGSGLNDLRTDMNTNVSNLNSRIDLNQTSIQTISGATNTLRNDLDALDARESQDYDALNDMVDDNTSDIAQLEDRMGAAETQILKNNVESGSSAIGVDHTDTTLNGTKVSLVINPLDNVLTQGSGLLATINLIRATGTTTSGTAYQAIRLLGRNNTIIDEINVDDFVKDGFLQSVTLEGTDLVFTWNTDSGQQQTRINVSDLFVPYVAGDGLALDDHTFSGVVDPDSDTHLSVGPNGFKLEGVDALVSTVNSMLDQMTQFEGDLNELAASAATQAQAIEDLSNRVDACGEEIDVLGEDIATLADSLSGITSDITDINVDLNELKDRMTTAEGNIATLDNTVSSLSDTVASHTSDIAGLEQAVEDTNATITNLANDLDIVSAATDTNATEIAGLDSEVDGLADRVEVLENTMSGTTTGVLDRLDSLDNSIAGLTNDIADINTQIVDLNDIVSAHTDSIAEIYNIIEDNERVTSTALNDLNNRVNEISGATEDIATLRQAVATNTNNISTLSGETTANTQAIGSLSGDTTANTQTISNIIGGVGLNSDGSHASHSQYYITGTTSVEGDIQALDAKLHEIIEQNATFNGSKTFNDAVAVQNDLSVAGDLTVNGSVSATTGYWQTSDARLKNFLGSIDGEYNLEKICQIPTKYFTWKSDKEGTVNIGTSAQQVEQLFPELVSAGEYLTVDYTKFGVLAIAAIKELVKKIEKLEKEIENLKK